MRIKNIRIQIFTTVASCAMIVGFCSPSLAATLQKGKASTIAPLVPASPTVQATGLPPGVTSVVQGAPAYNGPLIDGFPACPPTLAAAGSTATGTALATSTPGISLMTQGNSYCYINNPAAAAAAAPAPAAAPMQIPSLPGMGGAPGAASGAGAAPASGGSSSSPSSSSPSSPSSSAPASTSPAPSTSKTAADQKAEGSCNGQKMPDAGLKAFKQCSDETKHVLGGAGATPAATTQGKVMIIDQQTKTAWVTDSTGANPSCVPINLGTTPPNGLFSLNKDNSNLGPASSGGIKPSVNLDPETAASGSPNAIYTDGGPDKPTGIAMDSAKFATTMDKLPSKTQVYVYDSKHPQAKGACTAPATTSSGQSAKGMDLTK